MHIFSAQYWNYEKIRLTTSPCWVLRRDGAGKGVSGATLQSWVNNRQRRAPFSTAEVGPTKGRMF